MKWITREGIRVNRAATCWLIRRFLDPEPDFSFVPADQVASVQAEQNATGFDAPGATYPHKNEKGLCSFAALVEERLGNDLALVEMARIVQAADFRDLLDTHPAARGLALISYGFPAVTGDDHVTLEKASFLYDALYASLNETQNESSNAASVRASVGVGAERSGTTKSQDPADIRKAEYPAEKSPPTHLDSKISLSQALARLPGPNGERFMSVFERGSLIVEILQPPSPVPLPPHDQDEVYIVLYGSGELLNAGVRQGIGRGDFLFVPAGVEHHFENFTDDLTIWVIFYGPKGGEGESAAFEPNKT